jgi:nucleotide-binding universal stress UspA family protein
LEKTARHRHADLIIMGITGKSAIAQVFFGSNTLKMAERKVCPVLIIPETAAYSPIKNVMLTSDFKNTVETTPSGLIKGFLDAFKPQLHVVNVDNEHYISLTENYENEKQELKKMFADYNPEFYFMRLYDVDEAINLFAESRNIDLIIAIQKNHSFIGKLLNSSRTKTLSYHSKMPILVMHE